MLIARGLQSLELLTRPLNHILFLGCCCILRIRDHSLHWAFLCETNQGEEAA